MNIIPLVGVDSIKLGSTKEDVVNLIGEPDVKAQDEWLDNSTSDRWSYLDRVRGQSPLKVAYLWA